MAVSNMTVRMEVYAYHSCLTAVHTWTRLGVRLYHPLMLPDLSAGECD